MIEMKKYCRPQAWWAEQMPMQLLCQSNVDDMSYREGEWEP